MATMTLNQYAFTLGASDRITREYSLDWHLAYVKADEATQKAWRADFILHYIMGRRKMTEKQAAKVCAQTRTERSYRDQTAWKAGYMMFRDHVARDSRSTDKANKTEPTTRYRAPNGLAPVMQDLIKRFGRDELVAYLKAHK